MMIDVSNIGGEVADLLLEVELLVAHGVANLHFHDYALLAHH